MSVEMKYYWYIIYLCLCSHFQIIKSSKLLAESPGFDNPNAWISEYMPCALEQVVFPKTYAAVLPLPQQVDLSGFILPLDGAILLPQDGTIEFGNELKNTRKCQSEMNGKAYLKSPITRSWYNPQSWLNIPNKFRANTALPHLTQIPCDNEAVIITRNGPFAINLDQVQYLRLGQINLAGTLITKEYLEYLMPTELGQLLFQNSEGVSVEYYRNSVCGCHRDSPHLTEPVCHNVQGQCPQPHCLSPVLPYGGCCAICGAVLNFQVENCNNDQLQKVKKLIFKRLKEDKLEEELDIDVDFYNSKEYGKYLQIIAVDREEYTARSVNFLQNLNSITNWHNLLGGSYSLQMNFAGRHYNPNITFFSMLFIFLSMLFVLFVSLLIFAHYEPNHHILQHLPTWVYDIRRWRAFILHTQMMFSRFDQHTERLVTASGAQEIDDTIRVGADTMAIGYNAESGSVHEERSFDNPLFGTKHENIVLNVAKKREKKLSSLETGSLANMTVDGGHDEIQELQEIKLDTSSDESSDTEIETKK